MMADEAKKYGAQGGKKRAEAMTKQQLSEASRKAALARWGAELPRAVVGSTDNPLVIGGVEMPAYVLEDGRRVLAQRGLQTGIGLSRSAGKGGARRIVALMRSLERKGLDTKGLVARADTPIRFIPPHGGNPADGYEATILPDICAVLIEAGQRDLLTPAQIKLARQAALLQHGFATLGIIALVDKATGYEDYARQRDAAMIVEKFVRKELKPWVRRFPFEFYEKIFRLKGWDASELTPNSPKPLEVGRITDDLIYRRLAPYVRDELKAKVKRSPKGYLQTKLHRWLTDDIGDPKLEKQIAVVMAVMDAVLIDYPNGGGWQDFMDKINLISPRYGETLSLALTPGRRALPASTSGP